MKISVIGFGALGTAMATIYAKNNPSHEIILWGWGEDEYNGKKLSDVAIETRENSKYLPGIKIPENVKITDKEEDILGSGLLFIAIPYNYLNVLEKFKPFISKEMLIVCGTKGILYEKETKKLVTTSEFEYKLIEKVPYKNFIAMSGPNFAGEMAFGVKTTTVFGCMKKENAEYISALFASENLRTFATEDILGVEFAGALKNYPPLGAGICDFLIEKKYPGIGLNSKAALVGRSLEEIIKISTFHGAKRETFNMPCGTADLILTCYSSDCSKKDILKKYKSRNNLAGYLKGAGYNLKQIENMLNGKIAEGLRTVRYVRKFSVENKIRNNIAEQIYLVFYHNKKIENAINDLIIKQK